MARARFEEAEAGEDFFRRPDEEEEDHIEEGEAADVALRLRLGIIGDTVARGVDFLEDFGNGESRVVD